MTLEKRHSQDLFTIGDGAFHTQGPFTWPFLHYKFDHKIDLWRKHDSQVRISWFTWLLYSHSSLYW